MLKEYNYNLESFTFIPPGESYTLLDNPAVSEDNQTVKPFDFTFFDKRA